MSFRGFLMVLPLVIAAATASAADKRFKMEGGDTLVINAGPDWVVGEVVPDSLFGTLTLHGTDKALWRPGPGCSPAGQSGP